MTGQSDALIDAFLKENDKDRYFTTLVLPRTVQPAARALYAFAADTAAIPGRISAPEPGEIRLQWWADALAGKGHGDVQQNPLASVLRAAITTNNWPVDPLQRLIKARRFDLYNDPMPDWPAFEAYAGETNSALLTLVALSLGAKPGRNLANAAGHLGVAHALAGHLRAFGYNAAHGRIFLPWEAFAGRNVTREDVLSGHVTPGIAPALAAIAERARVHLAAARLAITRLPAAERPAFALIVLIESTLNRLPLPRTPFVAPPEIADWRKIGKMMIWTWKNKQKPDKKH